MPITLQRLTAEQINQEFKRSGNSAENLSDYIDSLQGLAVGDGFTVKVIETTRDDKLVELVPLSDDDDSADTVRAFKRRMNAAADKLGLTLKWRPKGHRTGEGENAHFVTDWLVVKATSSKAETSTNGKAAK